MANPAGETTVDIPAPSISLPDANASISVSIGEASVGTAEQVTESGALASAFSVQTTAAASEQSTAANDEPPSHTPSFSVAESVRRHEYFYFHTITFLVGDTLFRVPRYGLPGTAERFETIFATSLTDPNALGASDANPYRLEVDISEADFACFLKALYPPPGETRHTVYLTFDEWVSILKLAKRWKMTDLHEFAVAQTDGRIDAMTSIDKIVFGKNYGVPQWLRAGYRDTISRTPPITPEERDKIDLQTYVKLLELRDAEWVYHHRMKNAGYPEWGFDVQINESFEDEMKSGITSV